MAETVFSRILSGQLPCHRVFEDDFVLAFLDIAPLSPGHTLLIPKEPAETLDQLSSEASAALGRALPAVCRAVLKATGAKAFNVLQNNGALAHQAVFHVHFHIIPKFDADSGLALEWRPQALAAADAQALAARIVLALEVS